MTGRFLCVPRSPSEENSKTWAEEVRDAASSSGKSLERFEGDIFLIDFFSLFILFESAFG